MACDNSKCKCTNCISDRCTCEGVNECSCKPDSGSCCCSN